MRIEQKLADIIEEELEAAPVIEEFLMSGLSNISAVAKALRPLLISRLGRKVSISAVGMALRRYRSAVNKTAPRLIKFPKYIEIRSVSQLVEIAYRKNKHSIAALRQLLQKIESDQPDLFLYAQGEFEITILTYSKYSELIKKTFKKCRPTSILSEIGCVTVDWPTKTKEIPGIYYRITRALSRREISIQSFHTIGSEMMLVVKSSLLEKTLTSVTHLLNNSEFE